MADINRPSFTNLDQTTAIENINNLQTGIKQGMDDIISGDLANASSSLANIQDQFNALVDGIKNNNIYEQLQDKIQQTNLMIEEFRIKTEQGIEAQEKSIKNMTDSLPKVLNLMRDMESSIENINKQFGSTAELEKFGSEIISMKQSFDEIVSMPLLDEGTAINSAKKVSQLYTEAMKSAFQMADLGKDLIVNSIGDNKEEIANEVKKILSNTQIAMNIVPNVNNFQSSGNSGADLSALNKIMNEIVSISSSSLVNSEKTEKTLDKINSFIESIDNNKVNEMSTVDKTTETLDVLTGIRSDLKDEKTPKAGDNVPELNALKDYLVNLNQSMQKYSDLNNQAVEQSKKVEIAKEKYDEKPITRRLNVYNKENNNLENIVKQMVDTAKEIVNSVKHYNENIEPTINDKLEVNGENAKSQVNEINNSAVNELKSYDKDLENVEKIRDLINEIKSISDSFLNSQNSFSILDGLDIGKVAEFANGMNDIDKIFDSIKGKNLIGEDSINSSKELNKEINNLMSALNNVNLAESLLKDINDADISKYILENLENTKIKLSSIIENDNIDLTGFESLKTTEKTIKNIINNNNLENNTKEENVTTNENEIDRKTNVVNSVSNQVENIKNQINTSYLNGEINDNEKLDNINDISMILKDIERSVQLFNSVKEYGTGNTNFNNNLDSSLKIIFDNISKLSDELNTKTEKINNVSNYDNIRNIISSIQDTFNNYSSVSNLNSETINTNNNLNNKNINSKIENSVSDLNSVENNSNVNNDSIENNVSNNISNLKSDINNINSSETIEKNNSIDLNSVIRDLINAFKNINNVENNETINNTSDNLIQNNSESNVSSLESIISNISKSDLSSIINTLTNYSNNIDNIENSSNNLSSSVINNNNDSTENISKNDFKNSESTTNTINSDLTENNISNIDLNSSINNLSNNVDNTNNNNIVESNINNDLVKNDYNDNDNISNSELISKINTSNLTENNINNLDSNLVNNNLTNNLENSNETTNSNINNNLTQDNSNNNSSTELSESNISNLDIRSVINQLTNDLESINNTENNNEYNEVSNIDNNAIKNDSNNYVSNSESTDNINKTDLNSIINNVENNNQTTTSNDNNSVHNNLINNTSNLEATENNVSKSDLNSVVNNIENNNDVTNSNDNNNLIESTSIKDVSNLESIVNNISKSDLNSIINTLTNESTNIDNTNNESISSSTNNVSNNSKQNNSINDISNSELINNNIDTINSDSNVNNLTNNLKSIDNIENKVNNIDSNSNINNLTDNSKDISNNINNSELVSSNIDNISNNSEQNNFANDISNLESTNNINENIANLSSNVSNLTNDSKSTNNINNNSISSNINNIDDNSEQNDINNETSNLESIVNNISKIDSNSNINASNLTNNSENVNNVNNSLEQNNFANDISNLESTNNINENIDNLSSNVNNIDNRLEQSTVGNETSNLESIINNISKNDSNSSINNLTNDSENINNISNRSISSNVNNIDNNSEQNNLTNSIANLESTDNNINENIANLSSNVNNIDSNLEQNDINNETSNLESVINNINKTDSKSNISNLTDSSKDINNNINNNKTISSNVNNIDDNSEQNNFADNILNSELINNINENIANSDSNINNLSNDSKNINNVNNRSTSSNINNNSEQNEFNSDISNLDSVINNISKSDLNSIINTLKNYYNNIDNNELASSNINNIDNASSENISTNISNSELNNNINSNLTKNNNLANNINNNSSDNNSNDYINVDNISNFKDSVSNINNIVKEMGEEAKFNFNLEDINLDLGSLEIDTSDLFNFDSINETPIENIVNNNVENEFNSDKEFQQIQLDNSEVFYNKSEDVLSDVLDAVNIIQKLIETNNDSAKVEEVINDSVNSIVNSLQSLINNKTLPSSQVEYFEDLATNIKTLKDQNSGIKFGGDIDILDEESEKNIQDLQTITSSISNNTNNLFDEKENILEQLNSVNNKNISNIINNLDTSEVTFENSEQINDIINNSNQALQFIAPELPKIDDSAMLKDIVDSLNSIKDSAKTTLDNNINLPENKINELNGIINNVDNLLNDKNYDVTKSSEFKNNEIDRTKTFEKSVDKTEEKYNNIIFNTDENDILGTQNAIDNFIDSLNGSIDNYDKLAKSITGEDLNKNILDKLDLLIGTSEVVKNEFSDYTTEEQNSTLNNLISNLEEYKNEKNNYISKISNINNISDNSNSNINNSSESTIDKTINNIENSTINNGNNINEPPKDIFGKIEDLNNLDINAILYNANDAKEKLRNTTLDMMAGNTSISSGNITNNLESINSIMQDYSSVNNSAEMMQSTINNLNSLKEEYDKSEDDTYKESIKIQMENLYNVLVRLSGDISTSLSSVAEEKQQMILDNDSSRELKILGMDLGSNNRMINSQLKKISVSNNEELNSEEVNNEYYNTLENHTNMQNQIQPGESVVDNPILSIETSINQLSGKIDSSEIEQMQELVQNIGVSAKIITEGSITDGEDLLKYTEEVQEAVSNISNSIFLLDSILESNREDLIDNNELSKSLRILQDIDNLTKHILENSGGEAVERTLTDKQINRIENTRKTNNEEMIKFKNTKSIDISDAQKRMEEYHSIIHYSKDIYEKQLPGVGINALKATDMIDNMRLKLIAGNYSDKEESIAKHYGVDLDYLSDLKEDVLNINSLSNKKQSAKDRISTNMIKLNEGIKKYEQIPLSDRKAKEDAAEEVNNKIDDIIKLLTEYTQITSDLNKEIADLDIEGIKNTNKAVDSNSDFSKLYEVIMDSTENEEKANNALIEILERFGLATDENFTELYSTLKDTSKEAADNIGSRVSSGSGGIFSGKSGILSMILSAVKGVGRILSGAIGTINRWFGVNLNPISMLSGSIDYYKKFGQMDVSGTQAQMKQGDTYNPGLLEYNKDMGIQLYRNTYGLIGYDEYANQSNQLIANVQGHWGNEQTDLEGQQDMVDLSYPALLLNKVYDVDSTSAIKTFYKDLGMTAQETEAFMYKLVQTAQVSNIPVSEYVKTIEQLGTRFKELGLNAEIADISIGNLMSEGLDFSTATSMTSEYGSAISRFSQNSSKTGFYGVMSGQFGNVWEGMKAARDRWNDDGSVKEGSSAIVANMIQAEMDLNAGILKGNPDYQWTYIQDYLQGLGFSEKNSAILTNKYTSGDMEGFAEFFEKMSEESEEEQKVVLVNQDKLEAKVQVAADNTDELTKAQTMLEATEMELARVGNNLIDLIGNGLQNVVSALGGIMITLAQVIARGVDMIAPLLSALVQHPITAILAAIAGKLGIKALGAAITGKSTGIGGKITTSLTAGSKAVPIVSGVLDAGATFVDNYYVQDKTVGYSAGSAIGSGVGTGVGAWGGAKAGAALGTLIAPGIGTAVGTVIGAVAGGALGKFAGKTVTEAGMDYAGVQEYQEIDNSSTYNSYSTNNTTSTSGTNLTGMLNSSLNANSRSGGFSNVFYNYTGLTPYEVSSYSSELGTTYNIDDLYEITEQSNTSTSRLMNQYQMSQEQMTNLVTERIEDAISEKDFKDNGAKVELIAKTLQSMGYDKETSYKLAESYVSNNMEEFDRIVEHFGDTLNNVSKEISSNSYTIDANYPGASSNNVTTIYNYETSGMERLAEVPGVSGTTSQQYSNVADFIRQNTYQLTRSDIEDTNYESMDAETRKQAEALTNILNRYEQNSTTTSLTQNFEKFSDSTMSILKHEVGEGVYENKGYGIGLFGDNKEEAILNLISTTARDKQGLYALLSEEKYNLAEITNEFDDKFKERIESMGNKLSRMNYGQREATILKSALDVINEILQDTNKQINDNTDALKNAKLNIDTDEINSKLAAMGIKTKASDLDLEALDNKKSLAAVREQILQQDIQKNIENNQRIENSLIQKNYAMSSSYMESVDYVQQLVDQYNSVGSGSYSKDLSIYQSNIEKSLSDEFKSNSSKFKDEKDLFRTIGNDKETILELTSLAAGDKEELYSALSKVAGNEGKISDLMEKLYSQNMDKYREIVYKDGTKLQGTAEYEIAVATEVMKDALKKEKYLEDDDKFVVPGSLESIVNNLKTDKLTSNAVADVNFGRQASVSKGTDGIQNDSIILQKNSSNIYGEDSNKIINEQSLDAQKDIHDTLNQQIAESQTQANNISTNFDELIESASNEFELLQTIATVANYILNAVKVSQTCSKNIAEDLKDIANAKAILKVRTINSSSSSSNRGSSSGGTRGSSSSSGSNSNGEDFQFTGTIRDWVNGASNNSSSSNSNSDVSVMLGGSMGSSSSAPPSLRDALAATRSGSSSTGSHSSGTSKLNSGSSSSSSTTALRGTMSVPASSYSSASTMARTGSSSNSGINTYTPTTNDYGVSAMSYENSSSGSMPAASSYARTRTGENSGGSGGNSGLGSINEQMDQWDDLIIEMANKYGMDPALIKAVMYQESGGDPNATSPAGAMGLMQLMPGTAAGVASELGWSSYDPYNAEQSIEMGTYYLANLISTYDLEADTLEGTYANGLAAYNWGIGNYLSSGQRSNVENGIYSGLPGETSNYISNILGTYSQISNGSGIYSPSGHGSSSSSGSDAETENTYADLWSQAPIYNIGNYEYSNGETRYDGSEYVGFDPLMDDLSVVDMQGWARKAVEDYDQQYSSMINKYSANVNTVGSSSGNVKNNKQEFNININAGGSSNVDVEKYARAVQNAITAVTKEYYGTADVIGSTIYNSNNSRY